MDRDCILQNVINNAGRFTDTGSERRRRVLRLVSNGHNIPVDGLEQPHAPLDPVG